MVRALFYLALLAAAIAVIVWAQQRVVERARRRGEIGSTDGKPSDPTGEYRERCMMVAGGDRGPGILRLTPTQVVFAADSGRVLVIERIDIVGATSTTALPDHDIAKPVLVLAAEEETYYFSVSSPQAWLHELTG